MKTLLATLFAAAAAAFFTGCARSAADTGTTTSVEPAAHFKEGHGLHLTATGSKFVGLKTGDVASRDIGESRGVAAVPAEAVQRTVKGNFVYVVNGDWFLRTPVALGATDGEWIEIKDGLYEGDRIATAGTRWLWLAELQAVNGGVACADGH